MGLGKTRENGNEEETEQAIEKSEVLHERKTEEERKRERGIVTRVEKQREKTRGGHEGKTSVILKRRPPQELSPHPNPFLTPLPKSS